MCQAAAAWHMQHVQPASGLLLCFPAPLCRERIKRALQLLAWSVKGFGSPEMERQFTDFKSRRLCSFEAQYMWQLVFVW